MSNETASASVKTDDDGGAVVTQSDGTQIVKDSDGSMVMTKPDGSKIIKDSDGAVVVVNPNGTKIDARLRMTILRPPIQVRWHGSRRASQRLKLSSPTSHVRLPMKSTA